MSDITGKVFPCGISDLDQYTVGYMFRWDDILLCAYHDPRPFILSKGKVVGDDAIDLNELWSAVFGGILGGVV